VTNNIRNNNNNNSIKANLLTRRSNLDSVADYCNRYEAQALAHESNHLFDSMNNFNSSQMSSSYANEVMPKSSSILTTNSIKTRRPSKLLPSMKSPNSSTSMSSDNNLVIDLNSHIKEVNNELPHPCTQSGCWRRFRTEKALNWHLKKFHQ
jgi:hypothetical protein